VAKKPIPKRKKATADKDQRERFIKTAREIGADETGDALDLALARLVPPRRPKKEPE
jgi:hypothetical protein